MSSRLLKPIVAAALAAGLAGGYATQVRGEGQAETASEMIVLTPARLEWSPAPPILPPGAQVVVLEGDLDRPVPYTFRLRVPDGYRIAPHTHPVDERVTVLQGTVMLGTGSRFDPDATRALPVGSFFVMPRGHEHFVWMKGETVVQIHGVGPWGLTYVNPEDDPRNEAAAS
jgi:hypothetical protein